MKIMQLLTADNRCPELAEALAQGRVKLVRHVIKGHPPRLRDFITNSAKNFAEWQCVVGDGPGLKKLRQCDMFVSFCYLQNKTALFTGVFHNDNGERPAELDFDWHLSPELADIYHERNREDERAGHPIPKRFFFAFRKDTNFADIERRVIVEWEPKPHEWVRDCAIDHPQRVLPTLPQARQIFDEGYGG